MRLLSGLAATLAIGLSTTAFAAPAQQGKRDGGVYTATTTATTTSTTVATTTTTAVTTTTSTAIVYETAYVIENLEAPCLAGASTSSPIATAVAEPNNVGGSSGSDSGGSNTPVLSSSNTVSGSSSNSGSSAGSTSGGGSGGSSGTTVTTGTSGSSAGTPVNTNGGAPTVLNPITPPSVNPGDVTNLQPSGNGSYYFTPGGNPDMSIEHQFAEMNLTYNYPTVILPHSDYISDIKCLPNGQGLEIDFNSTDAYNYVKTHWTNGSFLLVTYSLGCEANTGEEAGDHVYWLVHDLVFNDAQHSVRVDAQEIAYEDAADEVHLIWGVNSPGGGNGTDVVISHSPGDGTPSTGSYNYNVSSPSTGGGNGTSGETGTCAQPPAGLNLPTAPCGIDFDTILDQEIGYFDFDNDEATDLEQFAPGLGNDVTEAEVEDINSLRKRKRPVVSKIQKADKSKAAGTPAQKQEASKLSSLVKQLPPIKPAKFTYSIKNLDPKFDIEFETRNSPNQLQDSPWGQAYNIYHTEKKGTTKGGGEYDASLDLYCVDCHFNAGVKVHGEVTWKLRGGVKTGYVSMNGNVDAGVYLGLDAKADFKATQTKNVLKAPIPGAGITVAKVFSAGMIVGIDVTATVALNAQTQILAGAGLTIPNFAAKLDFVQGGSFANGFTPQFTNRFEANGSATASLELGLPIGLYAEISVKGLADYKIGLKNTPSIKGSATISVGTANTLQADASCNNGLELSLGVADVTAVEFLGKVKEFGKIEKDKISTKCIVIPGLPTTPPAPVDGSDGSNAAADDSKYVDDNGTFGTTGDQDGSGDQVNVPADDDNSFNSETSEQDTDLARRTLFRKRSILKARDNVTINGTYAITSSVYNASASDVTYYNSTSGADFNSSDAASLANITTSYYNATSDSNNSTSQTLIYDSTGSYVLGQDVYNNFFLDDAANADAGYSFTTVDDVVVTDISDRAMFYYPDEMTALGVSRFRVADTTQIPTAADYITLTPIDYDESTATPGVYLAIDSQDNTFYTMYCNIQGLDGKIFLVDDLDAGLKTLMRPDLEMVITGGVVTDCQALELVSETFAGF